MALLNQDRSTTRIHQLSIVTHVEKRSTVVQLDAVKPKIDDGLYVSGIVLHTIWAAVASSDAPGRDILMLATVAIIAIPVADTRRSYKQVEGGGHELANTGCIVDWRSLS